jgi:aminoglycoside phosphotransferase (APT) family kinase protein
MLPLYRLDPAGSDHVIYRLGEELTVRLPLHDGAANQAGKEARWLPELAKALPLAIPEPVAIGQPGLGYPWHWAVSRWLPGDQASAEALGDSVETAAALADFLLALQAFPQNGFPADMSSGLADRDAITRERIDQAAGIFDADAMIDIWEAGLAAPAWNRPPVWYHGDFHTGNLLMTGGVVTAVIDFGGLGVGDPARDLTMAFALMSEQPRKVFRERLAFDDDCWLRGRAWALSGGVLAYTAYAASSPRIAAQTTRQINAALAES